MMRLPAVRHRRPLGTRLAPGVLPASRLDEARRRTLEVLPPLLVWLVIAAPAWAAVAAPEALGYFLVAFAAYWLWRSSEFVGGLLLGLWRLRTWQRRDWAAEARLLTGYRRVHHLVLIPTFKESEEILADTLGCLVRQSAPLEQVAVVLACEERDAEAPLRAHRLTQRFGRAFGSWLVTFHPDLPGEVKGKSSNLAWAARRVEEELARTGRLPADDLLVTVLDADSRLHSHYLAALAHETITQPDGRLRVYQPAILFYANYWRLPAALRAVGSSIFSLYSLARLAAGHRLVPQSTYSLSWWAARAVGYWDVDVIPEDSHMFFKLWLHLGSRVRAHAIYLPVCADAAEGPSIGRTLANHYQQIRRWAWGVSDIPYVVLGALRAHHIPRRVRLARVLWYVEEHLVWPSHWFILTLGGLLPPLLNPAYAATELAMRQAGAVSTLLSLCLPSLVIAVVADTILRPTPPRRAVLGGMLGLAGFAALPVTGLALSALPALDAHTRLLLGRSLAYQVTEKLPRPLARRRTEAGYPARQALPPPRPAEREFETAGRLARDAA